MDYDSLCDGQFICVETVTTGVVVDTEMKVPSVENPELTNRLPLKHAAIHASAVAGNFFIVLCSIVPVNSPSFSFQNLSYFLSV